MNSRLIALLALITVVGLLAAVLLLQDENPDAGPGSAVRPNDPQERGSTRLPEPIDRSEPSALPTVESDRVATPIPGSQISPTQVSGRVVSNLGTPMPGAEIACFRVGGNSAWMQYEPTEHTTTADELGAFRLVGLPDGTPLSLEVTHADAAPTTVEPLRLEQGQVLDLGDISVEVGIRLFGKVLDPDGRPVPDAHLMVSDMGRATVDGSGPEPILFAETVTDGLGEYSIEHLGRRQYTVDIEAEGFAPLQSAIAFMLNGPSGDFEQDYVLEEAGFVLGGVVLGPEEQSVPGATVSIVRRMPNNKSYYMLEQVTDARGLFRFDSVAEGRYEVRFSSPDWYLPLPRKLDAGDADHVLRAQHAITVVGQVITPGEMPDEITVTAKPDARSGAQLLGDRPRTRTYKPDADGFFEYEGLRTGTYVLAVEAAGYASTDSQQLVLGQDVLRVPVTVMLRPGGTITGQLAAPSPPATIELRDGTWDPLGPLDFAFPTQPVHGLRVKTGKSGAFRLTNVPAGAYVLSVKTPGMPDVHVRDIAVVDGSVVDVGDVARESGGSVAGTVTGTRGEPLAGSSISLSGPAARLRTTANLDGTFRFEIVPPGDYELTAVPKAFFEAFRFEAKAEVTVTSDQTSEVDLYLTDRKPVGDPLQR